MPQQFRRRPYCSRCQEFHEQLSSQFAAFGKLGCGWQVFSDPVAPEPPFQPFTGYKLAPVVDDGRVTTVGSSFLSGLRGWLKPSPLAPPVLEEPEPLSEPATLVRDKGLVELQTALPANLDIKHDAFSVFLELLAVCTEPIAFELIGTPERIVAQFAAHRRDAPILRRQLGAYFPDVTFLPEEGTLGTAWENAVGEPVIVEFGLENEFILPLLTGGKLDPFIGLIGAISELAAGEVAVFQVLFQQTENDWPSSVWRAVTDREGKALFANRPDLVLHAKEKLSSPLYGTVIRIAIRSPDYERAWNIARELAFSLRVFGNDQGNALVPLHNGEYPHDEHCEDVLRPAVPKDWNAAERGRAHWIRPLPFSRSSGSQTPSASGSHQARAHGRDCLHFTDSRRQQAHGGNCLRRPLPRPADAPHACDWCDEHR